MSSATVTAFLLSSDNQSTPALPPSKWKRARTLTRQRNANQHQKADFCGYWASFGQRRQQSGLIYPPALCRQAALVVPSYNVPVAPVLPKTHNQLQWQFFINTFTASNAMQPIRLDPVLLPSNTKSKPKRQLNGYVFLRKAEMLWQILQHSNTRKLNTARISLRWTTPTTLHLLFQTHHGPQRRCLPNQTILWFCNSYFMPQFCLILEYLQFWRGGDYFLHFITSLFFKGVK